MVWKRALGLWLLVVYGTTTWATNPGFVARITDKGLNYARELGVQVLQKELSKINVPDIHGRERVKGFGHVNYDLQSIVIHSFQLPASAITLVPGVGLKVSVSNAFIQLNGRWKVRVKIIKDHGSFDVKVKGLSIAVILKLGSDGTGRPTVSASGCSSHISSVKVHISGKLSFLYKLFSKKIDSAVRKAMDKQICPTVISTITKKLEPVLQTLPVTAKIDRFAGIEYSLVDPPLATAEALDLNFKGQFFDISNHTKTPFAPPPLILPVDHSRMLYFGLSEYFLNTAGYIYNAAGALVFNMTDDMIPKDFKTRLNTSSIGLLIPEVQKLYPNMLMMMHVTTDSAPFLTISPDKLTVTATGNIETFAILPSASLAPLFVLHLNTSISSKISVKDNKLVGSITLDSLQLALKHSDVGPFSVELLQEAVKFYISLVIVPRVNDFLAKGFPLPVLDKVKLTDVIVEPKQHFLLFAATVVYG